MKKFSYMLLLALAGTLTFTSCEEDDPEIPNEEELITTLKYVLTPQSGGGPVVELSFKDLDGDGGDTAVIVGATLDTNMVYDGVLTLLNEIENEDITIEIMDEDDEHQFFFEVTGADISVAYNDQDGNGNPVGLTTILDAKTISSGTLKVTLRHEPDKNAAGVANGDITNAGGETDIEVSFPIDVQ